MSSTTRRIHVKGEYRQETAIVGEAGIYPGMLVKLNSSGEMEIQDTEGGVLGQPILVALEDALQGNTVDTVYTADQKGQYIVPAKGTVVNLLLQDGQSITYGDILVPDDDGTVIKSSAITSGVTAKVAFQALETLDLSASANTTNELIKAIIA